MSKGPCPSLNCSSSDGFVTYEDGHGHCFVCGHHVRKSGEFSQQNFGALKLDQEARNNIRPIAENFRPLYDRGISRQAAQKFQVLGTDEEHIYPYFDKDGHHVANKIRNIAAKSFHAEGDIRAGTLFGQHLFSPGQRAITLVEGEPDALAVWDMFGRDYPCVSVKNGASGAVRDCTSSFEYLNSFEKIVICFDKDEAKVNETTGEIRYPGQEAAIAVASLFALGKVRILTLSKGKDANEYLTKGLAGEFVTEWWQAPIYTPSGLKLGRDMWDEISTVPVYETIPYPFDSLNKATYGIRLSELVLILADTGVGKTSLMKEIEYAILDHKPDDDKPLPGVGFLHLEEPNRDTALGLMSIHANRPLHLPDVRAEVTDDTLREHYDAVINNDRVVIWDHFGSNTIHEVLQKIRHMVALGCKYIFLDHLSIVVSDQSGDERKQLDEISTKIKTLCMELNIAVFAVIHTNRAGLARGSAGPEQLSNLTLQLYREIDSPDEWRRNVLRVTIKKNRFARITGPVMWAEYILDTGRLIELSKEQVATYLSGGTAEEKW